MPVFDVEPLRRLLSDPLRRFFFVELLASYTHVVSGSTWVATVGVGAGAGSSSLAPVSGINAPRSRAPGVLRRARRREARTAPGERRVTRPRASTAAIDQQHRHAEPPLRSAGVVGLGTGADLARWCASARWDLDTSIAAVSAATRCRPNAAPESSTLMIQRRARLTCRRSRTRYGRRPEGRRAPWSVIALSARPSGEPRPRPALREVGAEGGPHGGHVGRRVPGRSVAVEEGDQQRQEEHEEEGGQRRRALARPTPDEGIDRHQGDVDHEHRHELLCRRRPRPSAPAQGLADRRRWRSRGPPRRRRPRHCWRGCPGAPGRRSPRSGSAGPPSRRAPATRTVRDHRSARPEPPDADRRRP